MGGGATGGVSRIKLSDASVTAAWATSIAGLFGNSPIALAPDGKIYVGAGNSPGMRKIFSITSGGQVSTLATLDFQPLGLVVDSSGNVYTASMGYGGPSDVAGVYKVASGTTPTPTPTPSPTPTATTTAAAAPTAGKPTPGPALKVSDIPAEITLDLGSSTSPDGTIPPDQPITAEVPCNAPEGQLLDRCTVNVTAPQYVLLGQGDGINVRADKKVSIGKATVKAKSGKKTIIVKVKINQRGRKALKRNLKIEATVGLTAITVSNQRSTGDAETTMRLPTQLISPAAGIFDSNSTTLNTAGVAFVNRLAALLPKAPKNMVFIGFTDITGVPGDNRWIADRRAQAVRDALEAKGIDPAKSSIEVKASTSPRDDNATEAGRERNRRVSIRITY
jgi:outer membrane protein OmpA-like peptidoglycan-associated protein